MKNKTQKGITLIALVVTIIVLIILAGISVNLLFGDNGILNVAKKAKDEHEISEAKESLEIKIQELLIDELGNKDLNQLDGISINGYTTQVGNLGKIVTMTKGNESYNFLVDSGYEVYDLNTGSTVITDSVDNNSSNNNQIIESDIITSVNVDYIVRGYTINFTVSATTNNDEEILGYLLYCNNKLTKIMTENNIKLSNLQKNSNYDIYFEAIDKNGNSKKSQVLSLTTGNKEYVQNNTYACITGDGIKNIKYVNADDSTDYYWELDLNVNENEFMANNAIRKAAYDNDLDTSIGPYNATYTFIEIDESAWGKTLNITKVSGYQTIYFYNSNGTKIGGNRTSSDRASSHIIVIPENAVKMEYYFNESGRLYNMTVQ